MNLCQSKVKALESKVIIKGKFNKFGFEVIY